MKKLMNKIVKGIVVAAALVTMTIAPMKVEAGHNPVSVSHDGVTVTQDFDKIVSGHIVFYPSELTKTDKTYPVIVWANGTRCIPALYYNLLTQLAEGGYIVVANPEVMAADGKEQIASIDYILNENKNKKSIFYQHVDTEKIGAAGHSQGGRSCVNAAALDKRISCIFSIAGASNAKEAKKCNVPAVFTTGTLDKIVLPSLFVKPSYNAANGPAVYISLKKGAHTACILHSEKYADYMIQWFDGYLKDDAAALNVFKKGGALSQDSEWTGYKSKNF